MIKKTVIILFCLFLSFLLYGLIRFNMSIEAGNILFCLFLALFLLFYIVVKNRSNFGKSKKVFSIVIDKIKLIVCAIFVLEILTTIISIIVFLLK